MEERVVICENCGKRMPLASAVDFEGCTLCQDCFDQRTVVCDHCGTRIWADENAGDNYTHLCQSCYERYYVTCVRCGRVIHEDDACYEDEDSDDPLCEACYERCRNGKAIHDYYYKPVPIFFGKGPRYFGVELEIDEAGESDSNAEAILDVANGKFSHLYCKHDGSLEDGFEIVSHPMSLEYHLHQMPWAAVLNKARELGYCSHAARTCGLHLHISNDALFVVKDDNPMCIYHDASSGVYLYASTEEILKRALSKVRLPLKHPVSIKISCGDILRIDPSGKLTWQRFDDSKLLTDWYTPLWRSYYAPCKANHTNSHLDELKSVAMAFGYEPENIDLLAAQGFTADEIEEFFYGGEL